MSLPSISQQTRQTLQRQGFINKLYDDLKLSQWNRPRTFEHNLFTYSIMGLSALGYIVARRGGYTTFMFGASFVAAPIFALYQKRQLDFYQSTSNSLIHPKQLAQQFPIVYEQYNKVLSQVQEQIAKHKEILRSLQNQQ